MKRKENKKTLLKGEGIHQHTLYGNFDIADEVIDFAEFSVKKDSLLKHEKPNGSFGEHNTLRVKKGEWVLGKQVEFNPFDQKVSRVWD